MKPEKILAIRLSSLGDIISVLPAVACLKKRYPQAAIDWLVSSSFVDLLENNPDIDEVIGWDRELWRRKQFLAGAREMTGLVHRLRKKKYDVVYDFQNQFRSGLFGYAARIPRRTGFADSPEHNSMFYTEKIAVNSKTTLHFLERNLLLADCSLGCEKEFNIKPDGSDTSHVDELLKSMPAQLDGPVITICPSARWETKLWPPSHFAELAARLVDKVNARIVFVGTQSDNAIIEKIAAFKDFPYMSAAGKTTLRQLACLIGKSRLMITNDSGPMHIAAAMGVSTVSIFGPTNPDLTGPYGPNHSVVSSKVECVGCGKRQCPSNLECLHSITADQVLTEARKLLTK
jgi:lipopolysaccharide heptosyltransferase I